MPPVDGAVALAKPVATSQLRLPLAILAARCCTQGGVKKEAPSFVSSVKRVVQPSGATGALGKRQASLECIIINDSEGEPDISGHAAADASRTSLPSSCVGPTRKLEECKSAHRTTGRRSSSCEFAAKRHKPVQSQSQASDRACTSNADSHAKPREQHCITSKDGDKREPDVEGDVMQQDTEAGPAFELPSQLPRELRSWAWDKCACCLQQHATHTPLSLLSASGCLLAATKPCVSVALRVAHALLVVCLKPVLGCIATSKAMSD